MNDGIARTPAVIRQVHRLLPQGFPAPIAEAIPGGIHACAKPLTIELAV